MLGAWLGSWRIEAFARIGHSPLHHLRRRNLVVGARRLRKPPLAFLAPKRVGLRVRALELFVRQRPQRHARVTDAGVAHLRENGWLRYLFLEGDFSDAILEPLGTCEQLKQLTIVSAGVSDKADELRFSIYGAVVDREGVIPASVRTGPEEP